MYLFAKIACQVRFANEIRASVLTLEMKHVGDHSDLIMPREVPLA